MYGRRQRGVYVGSFRSWKEPWGFVVCPDFDGDLFAHRDNIVGECPLGDLAGMSCEFEIGADMKGRRTASSITVLDSRRRGADRDVPTRPQRPAIGSRDRPPPTRAPPPYSRTDYQAPPRTALPSRDPKGSSKGCSNPEAQRLVGERLRGEVRHWKGDWGFLICPSRLNGDVFAHRDNWLLRDPPREGMQVSFTVALDQRGRATAAEVTEAMARPEDLVDSGVLSGMVSTWKKDYGFIVSDAFEGELFCHQDTIVSEFNPETLASSIVGRYVSFEVGPDRRGRMTAQQVCFEDAADLEASFESSEADRELEFASKEDRMNSSSKFRDEDWYQNSDIISGTVRSWKSDWGFLVAPNYFEGDIFAHRDNLHGLGSLNAGDAVSFQVGPDRRGRDTALNITLSDVVERKAEDWLDDPSQLRGTFRTWKEPWGFVVSAAYTGDLFAHMENFSRSLPREHAREGLEVLFRVGRDKKGRCTAVDVEPARRIAQPGFRRPREEARPFSTRDVKRPRLR